MYGEHLWANRRRNEDGNILMGVLLGTIVIVAIFGIVMSLGSLNAISTTNKELSTVASSLDTWVASHPKDKIPTTNGYVHYDSLKSAIAKETPGLNVKLTKQGNAMVKIFQPDPAVRSYSICSYVDRSGFVDDDDDFTRSSYEMYDAASQSLRSAEPSVCK